jgi:hypothetical protein
METPRQAVFQEARVVGNMDRLPTLAECEAVAAMMRDGFPDAATILRYCEDNARKHGYFVIPEEAAARARTDRAFARAGLS